MCAARVPFHPRRGDGEERGVRSYRTIPATNNIHRFHPATAYQRDRTEHTTLLAHTHQNTHQTHVCGPDRSRSKRSSAHNDTQNRESHNKHAMFHIYIFLIGFDLTVFLFVYFMHFSIFTQKEKEHFISIACPIHFHIWSIRQRKQYLESHNFWQLLLLRI